jgi:hypothetical protein
MTVRQDNGEPEEKSGESESSARGSESEAATLQRPLSMPAEAGASSLQPVHNLDLLLKMEKLIL